jgi:hypothetical protein
VNINFKISTLLEMPTPSERMRVTLQQTPWRNCSAVVDEVCNMKLVEVTGTGRLAHNLSLL